MTKAAKTTVTRLLTVESSRTRNGYGFGNSPSSTGSSMMVKLSREGQIGREGKCSKLTVGFTLATHVGVGEDDFVCFDDIYHIFAVQALWDIFR